jgi:hypothetical protein
MNRSSTFVRGTGLVAAAMMAVGFLLPTQVQAADVPADDGKLRIIAFGAHPDDCEFKLDGTAAKVLVVPTTLTRRRTALEPFVVSGQFISVNGQSAGRLDSIFGWDKRQQQIVGAGFATGGAAGSGWTLSPADGKLAISAGFSVWLFKMPGDDTLVLENANGERTEYQRAK